MFHSVRQFAKVPASVKRTGIVIFIFTALLLQNGEAQVLTLKQAIETALANYGSIKAKEMYTRASQATVQQVKNDYLPNLVISAQQDYGTVNGQNGPLYGFGGYGVASSGLPLPNQNWNAAFGALYLANINWEFFAFGRAKEKIRTAESAVARDESDRQQELFQHQVKTAAAYLNLLAAQRISISQKNNLARADTFRLSVTARAKNGLIAGVDSSLANAELANAKISWIRAKDIEQERANELATLMGIAPRELLLDTVFIASIPVSLVDTSGTTAEHPLLRYYKSRIGVSNQQAKYFNTFKYPAFSLFGVFQTRGSGFYSNYATDQTAFDHKYFEGIKPSRSNYLLGVGVTWNLTSITRVNQQVISQQFISRALQHEYEVADQQIKAQQALAETRIKNAIDAYREVPAQLKAASDAFLQRSVLYRNGLTTIVDVTQALYALNRAEIDRDITYSNVWQALLLKAAATGNIHLFLAELR
ncbi:MAG: TolC family protein [Chitinophagaceae bacterium]|nr:TolC family protein [Chitinophagaceae bacterium]